MYNKITKIVGILFNVISVKQIFMITGIAGTLYTASTKYKNYCIRKMQQKKQATLLKNALETHELESQYLQGSSKMFGLDETAVLLEEQLEKLNNTRIDNGK